MGSGVVQGSRSRTVLQVTGVVQDYNDTRIVHVCRSSGIVNVLRCTGLVKVYGVTYVA
jgi:hypothetical protein